MADIWYSSMQIPGSGFLTVQNCYSSKPMESHFVGRESVLAKGSPNSLEGAAIGAQIWSLEVYVWEGATLHRVTGGSLKSQQLRKAEAPLTRSPPYIWAVRGTGPQGVAAPLTTWSWWELRGFHGAVIS